MTNETDKVFHRRVQCSKCGEWKLQRKMIGSICTTCASNKLSLLNMGRTAFPHTVWNTCTDPTVPVSEEPVREEVKATSHDPTPEIHIKHNITDNGNPIRILKFVNMPTLPYLPRNQRGADFRVFNNETRLIVHNHTGTDIVSRTLDIGDTLSQDEFEQHLATLRMASPIDVITNDELDQTPIKLNGTSRASVHRQFRDAMQLCPPIDAVIEDPVEIDKPKPTMAKITCLKYMIDNIKMIEILEMTGFMESKYLPSEYLNATPRVSYETDSVGKYVAILTDESSDWITLRFGDRISFKEYSKLIRIMKEAGQRLTDITTRIKAAKAWSGEFEVTI